jgi:hypothetical protein
MKVSDIIAGLIHLPRRFNSLGNVSIHDLLKETGYFEMHDQVSEESIHEALAQQPECVDEWISYSEDKRSSTGWYLKQEDGDTYVVGYFAGKNGEHTQFRYAKRIAACAAFIKRESENIRHNVNIKINEM